MDLTDVRNAIIKRIAAIEERHLKYIVGSHCKNMEELRANLAAKDACVEIANEVQSLYTMWTSSMPLSEAPSKNEVPLND
jgi:hypothetical protein